MPNPNETPAERRKRIVKMINENGPISLRGITPSFPEVDERTLQRDLQELKEAGEIKFDDQTKQYSGLNRTTNTPISKGELEHSKFVFRHSLPRDSGMLYSIKRRTGRLPDFTEEITSDLRFMLRKTEIMRDFIWFDSDSLLIQHIASGYPDISELFKTLRGSGGLYGLSESRGYEALLYLKQQYFPRRLQKKFKIPPQPAPSTARLIEELIGRLESVVMVIDNGIPLLGSCEVCPRSMASGTVAV